MTFIFAQRGATSLGFQIGILEVSFLYPRYWFWPYRLFPRMPLRFPQFIQIRLWEADR